MAMKDSVNWFVTSHIADLKRDPIDLPPALSMLRIHLFLSFNHDALKPASAILKEQVAR